MAPVVKVLLTPADAGAAAAQVVQELAHKAIAERGRFVVAFSGGSLPKTLCPHLIALNPDFSKWRILFADERCVPLEHDLSNYRELQVHLLARIAVPIPMENVFTLDPGCITTSSEATAIEYENSLYRGLGAEWRADVVLLGMGEDGHTASLFPSHPLLLETKLVVAPITDSPKPPPSRITLTLPTLNKARSVIFLACGAGKKQALEKIMCSPPDSPADMLPAGRVQPETGSIYWFIDEEAAPESIRH